MSAEASSQVMLLDSGSNTVGHNINTVDGVGSSVFFIVSLTLHGISAFVLTLALNHQRKYRSTNTHNSILNPGGPGVHSVGDGNL
jgi:hypothetical protein